MLRPAYPAGGSGTARGNGMDGSAMQMENRKKTIGILGGMGPLATADLFRKVILLTEAGSDQEHIRIYIDNNTQIPDRTGAILRGGEDPMPALTDSVRKLEACGADCLIVGCNTAHYFLPGLQALTKVPLIDMQKVCAEACRARFPGKTAAVLATSGTLAVGLYQRRLTEAGVPFLIPDENEQAALMRVIYQGVKAGAAPETYREDMERVQKAMTARGADFFILGCTELPLAFEELRLPVPAMDPTEELAKAAIRFCGYRVKGEQPEERGR